MTDANSQASPFRGKVRYGIVLAIIVGAIYALSANYGPEINVDAEASALAAWSIAKRGTVAVPEFRGNPWIVESKIGPVSNRPLGTFLLAVPFYFFSSTASFTPGPGTICAVVCALFAVLLVYLILCRFGSAADAMIAALAFAFGTATWAISANQLWPHSVTQLMLALAMLAFFHERMFLSGLALGFAIMARAPLAVAAIFFMFPFFAMSGKLKVFGPWILGISIGVIGLVLYNDLVFSAPSVTGGYSPVFKEHLLSTPVVSNFSRFTDALIGSNGLFIWSPMLLVLMVTLPGAWKGSELFEKSLFVGAIVYLIVHVRMGQVSGGLAFNYRYPLESLTLMAPILFRASALARPRKVLRAALCVAALISIGLQALYVFALRCDQVQGSTVLCGFF